MPEKLRVFLESLETFDMIDLDDWLTAFPLTHVHEITTVMVQKRKQFRQHMEEEVAGKKSLMRRMMDGEIGGSPLDSEEE